jgi:hypothetical protein
MVAPSECKEGYSRDRRVAEHYAEQEDYEPETEARDEVGEAQAEDPDAFLVGSALLFLTSWTRPAITSPNIWSVAATKTKSAV